MGLYLNMVRISKATYRGLVDLIVLALMQFEIRKFRPVPVGDETCSHWKRNREWTLNREISSLSSRGDKKLKSDLYFYK